MKNKIAWAIDPYIFDRTGGVPYDIFDKLDIELYEINYIPFMEDVTIPYDKNDCVITYGTINAIRHLKEYYGTFLRDYNLTYHMYSSNYNVDSRDFLNHDHFFVTFEYLKNNKDWIYSLFGIDQIFIRPNSGNKSFTGKVIPYNDFELEMDCMKSMYNNPKEELIVVSSPKEILEESRFIICDNEAIAHSRYIVNGAHKEDRNTSPVCIDFVDKILQYQDWTPEEIFTLDVALTGNSEPKIIELNSFSCAGWYDCDEETVISRVSEFTYNMWNEQYGK